MKSLFRVKAGHFGFTSIAGSHVALQAKGTPFETDQCKHSKGPLISPWLVLSAMTAPHCKPSSRANYTH